MLGPAACGPGAGSAAGGPPPEQVPDVTLYGVRLQSFEGEQLVAAGRAERATYQRGTGGVVASQMVLRLPSRPGAGGAAASSSHAGLEVRAVRLEGNLGSRQAVAGGGVVLRTSTGIVARSASAALVTSPDGHQRNIRGQEPVTVQGPNYRHRADAFDLALGSEVFTFSGNVQSEFEGVSPTASSGPKPAAGPAPRSQNGAMQ
nr:MULTISPECIES: hypothetical protein [Myxococcaceae]